MKRWVQDFALSVVVMDRLARTLIDDDDDDYYDDDNVDDDDDEKARAREGMILVDFVVFRFVVRRVRGYHRRCGRSCQC